jgi:ATPase
MPVSKKNKKNGMELLAEKEIIDIIRRFDPNPSVEFLSESRIRVFVSKESIPSIIGRNGSTIKELENELNLHIDVEESSLEQKVNNYAIPFDFLESRTALLLDVGREYSGNAAEIFVNNEFLISSKINRKGNIKILKRSSDGKLFSKVVNSKNDIEVFLKNR